MAATMYFCKREMIEVDSKNQTKPHTSHKFLSLHPHPFTMGFCHSSHQEMGSSFYSLDLDLTVSVALATGTFTNGMQLRLK